MLASAESSAFGLASGRAAYATEVSLITPPKAAVPQARQNFPRVVTVPVAIPARWRQHTAFLSLPEPISRQVQLASGLRDTEDALLRLHASMVGATPESLDRDH